MEKVSIIVPVYNGEKYIGRCLNSLINQSYDEIEVLVINDGSNDNSQFIIEEYVDSDDRIKAFNIENHGVSFARNYGINKVTGEYIMFCDADDYYEVDAVKKMIAYFDNFNCDSVFSNYYYIYHGKSIFNGIKKNEVISKIEAINILMSRDKKIMGTPWAKMFKKSIIKGIWFDENIYYGEDYLWLIQVIEKTEKILLINDSLYYYCFNESSAVNKPISKKNMTDLFAYEKSIVFLQNKGYETQKYDFTYIDMIFKNLPYIYKFDKLKLDDYIVLMKKKIKESKYSRLREVKRIVILLISIIFPDKCRSIFRLLSIIKHPFLYMQGKL